MYVNKHQAESSLRISLALVTQNHLNQMSQTGSRGRGIATRVITDTNTVELLILLYLQSVNLSFKECIKSSLATTLGQEPCPVVYILTLRRNNMNNRQVGKHLSELLKMAQTSRIQ